MLVIGLSGGLNWDVSERFQEVSNFLHDAAAVAVRDGQIVAALEEERVNRLKHSNKFPIGAVRHCLEAAGVTASGVDRWAYCFGNVLEVIAVNDFMADMSAEPRLSTPEIIAARLSAGLGEPVSPSAVTTVHHHDAHVASAFEPSGFDSALVVSYDGGGDDGHGKIVSVVDGAYETLATLGDSQSLGLFYRYTMRPLGYGRFDEYKVMGLAPYGDPARYRSDLATLYTLGHHGRYDIHFDRFQSLLGLVPVRRPGEPFSQAHKDLAASIQEALETMAWHLIEAARVRTGHRHLCLAGGVALNCTFNGRLAAAGRFDEIFVQPVATDAGAALGAALHVERAEAPRTPRTVLAHVYVGRVPSRAPLERSLHSLERSLESWSHVLAFGQPGDLCAETARRLSEGAVAGWVQGRSEFGPRALGNRSIVADPRPAANKDRVNLMVKKREAYRPFAPSVLAEHASEYFDLPPYPRRFAYMNFAVPVWPGKRELLQATTHVDGSSRVQVVYEDVNPRYWRLIDEFRRLTGVPVLLNTSFNNNAEPMVDSADDAIQCFLTTGLDVLVIDDYLVTKTQPLTRVEPWMAVSLPATTQLVRGGGEDGVRCSLRKTVADSRPVAISAEAYAVISRSDGAQTVEQALEGAALSGPLAGELFELWQKRLIRADPGA